MIKEAPAMFAIGSKQWPGLSKLAEEAGEVLQVVGKFMGTGGDPWHWDKTNLRTRLIEELGDLMAACEFVAIANGISIAAEECKAEKLKLFFGWHNEQVGRL